jgi:hypothetical protein
MWSTYLSGCFAIRSFASRSSAARSPYLSAPAGQCLTHAGSPARSLHIVHLSIFGESESHSAIGTPHGHAHWQ